MTRSASVVLSLLFLSVLVLAFAQDGTGGEKSSPPSADGGLYTVEQAERGQQAYFQSCASCHGIRLNGGMGPALTGDPFMTQWGNRTTSELLDFTMENMPLGIPGTLSDQAYADIIAFILSNNGHASGSTELTVDTEELAATRVNPEAE